MRNGKFGHPAVAGLVAVCFGLAGWWIGSRTASGARGGQDQRRGPVAESPAIPSDALAAVDADEQVNIRVYAGCNRGVVNITVSSVAAGFFDDPVAGGSGSGFLIDDQGHILTNYHVVENAREVQVTYYDGTTGPAEVIGTDPSTDLAVVESSRPRRARPLETGRFVAATRRAKVLAVGNPFGLERTLTTGIISALDRSIKARNRRTIKGIIQTDAAINPGNSGGPLLNTRGEVIGMNTAIISQVGQSAGIGFAVPISAIRRILPQLVERGFVVRADIGISRCLKTDEGLILIDLAEDGPASRAGLRPARLRYERVDRFTVRRRIDADILVAIDGKAVRGFEELLTEVESRPPGTAVTLDIVRGGRKQQVSVILGESGPE
ncbi:MAG: trypsin-like peptidase domain-containing protein [Isosphaeraceae bacterium]